MTFNGNTYIKFSINENVEIKEVFNDIKLLDSKIRDSCGDYDLVGGYYKTTIPFYYFKFRNQIDKVSYQYLSGDLYNQNFRKVGFIYGKLRGDKLYDGEWRFYSLYGEEGASLI